MTRRQVRRERREEEKGGVKARREGEGRIVTGKRLRIRQKIGRRKGERNQGRKRGKK